MSTKKVLMGLAGAGGLYVSYTTLKSLGGGGGGYAKATKEQIAQASEMFKLLEKSDSNSLLKKHLTRPIFNQLKGRATSAGGSLYNVIVSGAKNPEAHVGVYAPDAEAYVTFAELFDPIIQDYHKLGPKASQPKMDLGEGKTDQLAPLDPAGKYILSTRIRCGRSIKGYPLNPLMSEDQYKEMEKRVKGAVEGFSAAELRGKYYPLLGMTRETQTQLIKDHFLFKDNDRHLETVNAFHYWPVGRGIFHNDAKTFLIWLGEEDHMRIISMESGGDVGKVLKRLNKGIREIEAKVPFIRDERFGWITFCPTNLGSTVRASVHIKLPKVSARQDFEKLCDGLKLQVRGIHGEGSKSEGGVYDISNKRRLGLSEFQAVKEMYDGIKTLIEMEENGGKLKVEK